MGRGKELTDIEQGQILAYRESGMTTREIATRIRRSKTVVINLLKLREQYGQKKSTGRKPVISARNFREIKRLAVHKSHSPAEIQRSLNLNVTVRRVQQILKADCNLEYTKRVAKPRLTIHHKRARLDFAEKHQFWEEEWTQVVFSDEKKFNLDGPDGSQKYWHDTRAGKQERMSRNFGGGSLMIWGAMGYYGKTPICIISTKMNATKYVELLDDLLTTYGDEIGGTNWIFQQDNAPIHSAKLTKQFFNSSGIPLLDWPACSPDLNPIENLWAILSERVFKNGRQFDSVRQLKEAVKAEWTKIDQEVIKKLINSMPRRLQKVIINQGANTDY